MGFSHLSVEGENTQRVMKTGKYRISVIINETHQILVFGKFNMTPAIRKINWIFYVTSGELIRRLCFCKRRVGFNDDMTKIKYFGFISGYWFYLCCTVFVTRSRKLRVESRKPRWDIFTRFEKREIARIISRPRYAVAFKLKFR